MTMLLKTLIEDAIDDAIDNATHNAIDDAIYDAIVSASVDAIGYAIDDAIGDDKAIDNSFSLLSFVFVPSFVPSPPFLYHFFFSFLRYISFRYIMVCHLQKLNSCINLLHSNT